MKASPTRQHSTRYHRVGHSLFPEVDEQAGPTSRPSSSPPEGTDAVSLPAGDAKSSTLNNEVVCGGASGEGEVVRSVGAGTQPVESSSGETLAKNRGSSIRLAGIPNAALVRYQRSTELEIPRLTFQRVVRDITKQFSYPNDPFRMQADALAALQDAAETHIISLFVDGSLAVVRRNGKQLYPKDLALARRIRGNKPY